MKKTLLLALMLMVLGCSVSGCKGELSKEEVVQSSYYQELLEKYHKKKDRADRLQDKLKEARSQNQGRNEAEEFLEQVERGYFIKIQINDRMGRSYFVDYQPVFSYIKNWISRAQWLPRYDKETTIAGLEPTYEYYIYDEDNSTYMMQVYENDYVCFQERPEDVFVIYGANDMGNAFVSSGDMEYTNLLKQLEHSYLAVKGEKQYYESKNIKAFARALDNTEKKKGKKTEKKPKEQFLFFYHGQVIQVDFYESRLAIIGKEKQIWYGIEEKDLTVLRKILKQKT